MLIWKTAKKQGEVSAGKRKRIKTMRIYAKLLAEKSIANKPVAYSVSDLVPLLWK